MTTYICTYKSQLFGEREQRDKQSNFMGTIQHLTICTFTYECSFKGWRTIRSNCKSNFGHVCKRGQALPSWSCRYIDMKAISTNFSIKFLIQPDWVCLARSWGLPSTGCCRLSTSARPNHLTLAAAPSPLLVPFELLTRPACPEAWACQRPLTPPLAAPVSPCRKLWDATPQGPTWKSMQPNKNKNMAQNKFHHLEAAVERRNLFREASRSEDGDRVSSLADSGGRGFFGTPPDPPVSSWSFKDWMVESSGKVNLFLFLLPTRSLNSFRSLSHLLFWFPSIINFLLLIPAPEKPV